MSGSILTDFCGILQSSIRIDFSDVIKMQFAFVAVEFIILSAVSGSEVAILYASSPSWIAVYASFGILMASVSLLFPLVFVARLQNTADKAIREAFEDNNVLNNYDKILSETRSTDEVGPGTKKIVYWSDRGPGDGGDFRKFLRTSGLTHSHNLLHVYTNDLAVTSFYCTECGERGLVGGAAKAGDVAVVEHNDVCPGDISRIETEMMEEAMGV